MISEHRGAYSIEQVNTALDKTRISENNRRYVISFLVDGVPITKFPASRQQVWSRVDKVLRLL